MQQCQSGGRFIESVAKDRPAMSVGAALGVGAVGGLVALTLFLLVSRILRSSEMGEVLRR